MYSLRCLYAKKFKSNHTSFFVRELMDFRSAGGMDIGRQAVVKTRVQHTCVPPGERRRVGGCVCERERKSEWVNTATLEAAVNSGIHLWARGTSPTTKQVDVRRQVHIGASPCSLAKSSLTAISNATNCTHNLHKQTHSGVGVDCIIFKINAKNSKITKQKFRKKRNLNCYLPEKFTSGLGDKI